jgi:hypothetical protein
MTMASRNRAVRTTYFLGAGASVAETGEPAVTEDLLAHALRSPPRNTAPETLGAAQDLVGFLAPDGDTPSIDDVLSLIDVAVFRNGALSPEWSPRRLADVRRDLEHLMYAHIEATLHRKERRNGPLTGLLRSCESTSTAVVTLNWDCLVERSFCRFMGRSEGVIDYRVACLTPDGRAYPVDAGALLVLKPHGSLSWGLCPLCGCLVADLVKPQRFHQKRKCPVCLHTALEFILVPPAFTNHSTPWLLDAVWDEVERAIRGSDRVIFIGYSFPPQDVDVRFHVVRALAQRDRRAANGSLTVEVVTKKNVKRPYLEEVERSRYRAILGRWVGPEALQFHADGLEAWLDAVGA